MASVGALAFVQGSLPERAELNNTWLCASLRNLLLAVVSLPGFPGAPESISPCAALCRWHCNSSHARSAARRMFRARGDNILWVGKVALGQWGCVELELDPCPASGSLRTLWARLEELLVMFCLWVPNSWWFGRLLGTLSKCHTFQGGHLGIQN